MEIPEEMDVSEGKNWEIRRMIKINQTLYKHNSVQLGRELHVEEFFGVIEGEGCMMIYQEFLRWKIWNIYFKICWEHRKLLNLRPFPSEMLLNFPRRQISHRNIFFHLAKCNLNDDDFCFWVELI